MPFCGANNAGSRFRRHFLVLSLLLSVVGCAVALAAVVLPAWQVTPLDRIRARDATIRGPSRRCTIKIGRSLLGELALLRMAVEEDDLSARELLKHRFLPQHKAVLFFSVFTLLFTLISVGVGAFCECFVPNAILQLASVGLATSCSLLADVSFFIGANRDENRRVPGPMGIHQQHLSYAFFVHVLASSLFVIASLCSAVACYLLLLKQQQTLCAVLARNCWGDRSATKHQRQSAEGADGGTPEGKRENIFLMNAAAAVLRHSRVGGSFSSLSDRLPPPPPTPQLFQQPNWLAQYSFMAQKCTVETNTVEADEEWSAV
ncbi:Clc-like [Globodera pallida]|nr:Clc-like [Globodera pallida]